MRVWRWFDTLFRRFRVRVGLESPITREEPGAPDPIAEIARQECEKLRQRFESGALFASLAKSAAPGGTLRCSIVETRPGAPDAVHQVKVTSE